MEDRRAILKSLTRLERWGAARGWVGPDPYEGLNSPLGRLARGRRPRQAVIQAYKRLPFAPPWPLRTRSQPNAKTLALALSGYAGAGDRALPQRSEHLERLPAELRRLAIRDASGSVGWGYHFDVQTRSIRYGAGEPNAIATCFVVEGLLDAAAATGERQHVELALDARDLLVSLLRQGPRGRFFAYVEAGSELIHNANLMVAGALARLSQQQPHAGAEEAARDAAATTIALQRPDGLWPYGERGDLGWRDSFHTVYVLDGLLHLRDAFGVGADALERGLPAWRSSFIAADGAAGMYPRQRYPLEAHCYASAIDLLWALHGRDPSGDEVEIAIRVASSSMRELWIESEGRFAFMRSGRRLNEREFMRWTNAPMFRALARLAPLLDRG